MSSAWLNSFRRNITSQNGEDGVLEAIFDRIGEGYKWCCELGAWDGLHFSNTYNLIAHHKWSAVLVEADPGRFEQLVVNVSGSRRVIPVRCFVRDVPPDTLDNVLSKTPIPKEFDLLSIDVDNDDYLIWRTLERYHPRVVVIEVNSSYPPGVRKIPKRGYAGRDRKRGASIESTVALAKDKGYELALHTGNATFVLREYAERLCIDPERWQQLFDDSWTRKPHQWAWDYLKRLSGPRYREVRSILERSGLKF
jgi:hypothetical protein